MKFLGLMRPDGKRPGMIFGRDTDFLNGKLFFKKIAEFFLVPIIFLSDK